MQAIVKLNHNTRSRGYKHALVLIDNHGVEHEMDLYQDLIINMPFNGAQTVTATLMLSDIVPMEDNVEGEQ